LESIKIREKMNLHSFPYKKSFQRFIVVGSEEMVGNASEGLLVPGSMPPNWRALTWFFLIRK
jgi:hypothetical protein